MVFSRLRRITPIQSPEDPTNETRLPARTMAWLSFTTVHAVPTSSESAVGSDSAVLALPKIKPSDLFIGLYHWVTCLFITALVCSQLLGAVWNTTSKIEHHLYGRSPLLGPSQIVGTNDVPYSDRVIACVRRGRFYEPQLVSSLLSAPGVLALLEDSSGKAMHGYRLKQRRNGKVKDVIDSLVRPTYEHQCAMIANATEHILNACVALGYTNLTNDNLRVIDDWDSNNLYLVPHTLPVVIMPFWDNSPFARHAVPTWGGDACIFRLEDAFITSGDASLIASFRGVNRSVHHNRTIAWLDRPGGYWKNGWYEDLGGMRWYSDVVSSVKTAPYYMMHRVFHMRSGVELNCSDPSDCEAAIHIERWGDKFSSGSRAHAFNSVYIANATEFGLYLYEAYEDFVVRSVFDWQTLVSNLSIGLVLFRWAIALAALQLGALRGKTHWFSGGIGCVSGAPMFKYLPLVSLPRLKMILAAFWTVGCKFEGQQSALAEAWFVIYPAIPNFVLIYYSLLNILAKVLRRRISDALFAPTVLALCLLHYFRLALAESGWLHGVDGRVPTVVFSDEAEKQQLTDYFIADAAWRMNGHVKALFMVKLIILGINLLPLLVVRPFPVDKHDSNSDLRGVEKALGLRTKHVGGIGRSLTYLVAVVDRKKQKLPSANFVQAIPWYPTEGNQVVSISPLLSKNNDGASVNDGLMAIALVNSYELVRLGYLVFGDKFLIAFDDWDLISSMAPFQAFCHFWNHRVLVRELLPATIESVVGGRALASTQPQMWRLDDPRLQGVRWWQVSTCNIQC